MERKRQKKLRQKEQKEKEQRLEDEAEIEENDTSTLANGLSAEASQTFDIELHNPDTFADHVPSLLVPFQCPNTDEGEDGNSQSNGCVAEQNIEQQTSQGHNRRRIVVGQPKSQWTVANGFHANQNTQISKLGVTHKHGSHRDQRAASMPNGNRVWSRKAKPEMVGVNSTARLGKELDQGKNHEVLIGSISVTLGNCSQSEDSLVTSREAYLVENLTKYNSHQEKPIKHDSVQISNNRPSVKAVKLWRPVSRHGTKDTLPVQSGDTEADVMDGKGDDQNLSDQSCLRFSDIDNSDSGFGNNSPHLEDRIDPGSIQLSSQAAKAFLAESKLYHLCAFF